MLPISAHLVTGRLVRGASVCRQITVEFVEDECQQVHFVADSGQDEGDGFREALAHENGNADPSQEDPGSH